jgi:hypothetical protein
MARFLGGFEKQCGSSLALQRSENRGPAAERPLGAFC